MPTKKLDIWNHRMMLLMKHCIDSDLCESQKDFLEGIGFVPTGLRLVKSGDRGFTIQQIVAAAKKYKVNVNWIVGLEQEMSLSKKKSALQTLKEAVRSIEAELTN